MPTLASTPRSFAPVGLALACTLVPASYAANITWANSAGNTTWTTNSTLGGTAASNSWAGGNAPVNSVTTDNAIFTSVSDAQPALTVQTRIAGIDFQMAAGGLAMNGGGGSGQLLQVGAGGIDSTLQTSGTNTITNARIAVFATSTWNLFSNANTASTSTFTFNSAVDLPNNLTIAGQRDSAAGNVGVINFERAITGTGTLTINSSNTNNTVNLKGVNTYAGVTNVNVGIVNVSGNQTGATGGWNIQTPNDASAGKLATVNFATGSQFEVASANKIQIGATANSGSHQASTLNVAGTVTNNGTLQMERASNLNLNSGAIWTQNGTLTLTARGGGSATLTVNAGAEMAYSGSNTVKLTTGTSGNARLNINGTGQFTTAAGFENTTAAATGSGVSRITLTDGGTLRLSADVANLTTQTQLALAGTGGVIDNAGFNTTLSGANTAGSSNQATGITGVGGLTSTGIGTLTLSGNNTYTGATLVSAGTLAIGSTGSINSTSGLTVASGATFRYNSSTAYSGGAINNNGTISGTGTLNVAVTLDSLTDTLAPGNSPGVQNFGGGQTWNSFTYEWEINNFTGTDAGIDFDKVTIGGSLNLTGGPGAYVLDIHSLDQITNLTGDAANFSESSVSWTILTASGGITGFNGANWSLIKTNFTNAELGTFALAQSGNDLILTYTPVPEPSAYAAIAGFGMMGFALYRRRRRQQQSAAA
jgi:autotransporter-associated beta strand protein